VVERGCGHRGCVGGDGRRGAIAAAETGSPGSDAKGTTSAESTKSTESKADSHKEGASTPNPNPSGKKPKKDAPADPKGANETDAAQQDDEDKIVAETEPPARQPDEQPTATAKDAEPAGSDTAEKPAAFERKPAAKPRPSKRSRSRRPRPNQLTFVDLILKNTLDLDAEPQLRVLRRADRRHRRCADRVLYRKCPPQTQRYLLTDGLRQATLLGSMCARVKDASQRPG
jgi:hypothetical protein